MKVVSKTILDKILALLPDEYILRIELTVDEFTLSLSLAPLNALERS